MRPPDKATEPAQCREKIQSYLTGSLRTRPDVDLNSYYVLALNKSADISVIDPLLGFGGSKLLTLVMLKSPGEDWLLTQDGEKLFVTLPLINQVAVVDTRSWKVTNYIETGTKPTRITMQPDQHYLWVANDDGADGYRSIELESSREAADWPWPTRHCYQQRQPFRLCVESCGCNCFDYRHSQTGKTLRRQSWPRPSLNGVV